MKLLDDTVKMFTNNEEETKARKKGVLQLRGYKCSVRMLFRCSHAEISLRN
jgi:hypothetical protein